MRTREETYHLLGKIHKERITPLLCQIFDFEHTYQAERLATKIRYLGGKKFKLKIKEETKKKSREALGFYFGAICRATAMDSLELKYDPEQIPGDWREYRKNGKITPQNADDADLMLRLEFFYEWKKNLAGEDVKVPKSLSDKDNPELLILIDKVMEYRIENGYPYLDVEKYNKRLNRSDNITPIPDKKINYPTNNLKPKI